MQLTDSLPSLTPRKCKPKQQPHRLSKRRLKLQQMLVKKSSFKRNPLSAKIRESLMLLHQDDPRLLPVEDAVAARAAVVAVKAVAVAVAVEKGEKMVKAVADAVAAASAVKVVAASAVMVVMVVRLNQTRRTR